MRCGPGAILVGGWASGLAACSGPQSTLSPAGRDAERIATLFYTMTIGGLVIWLLVVGVTAYAVIRGGHPHGRRVGRLLIVGGGVVLPLVVLTALLAGGLRMLPELLDLGPGEEPAVVVSAEQYWWRMTYALPDGSTVELANELRLPVGERLAIAVESPDVIHSFWVPSLGFKVDAIPGRTTYVALEPTRPGTFRGICAEYCGVSHARMVFYAMTMEPEDYRAWLEHQAQPARPPADERTRRGQLAFLSYGCGACHTIRGTPATGAVGPDLTHVGSRLSVAGVHANDVDGFRRWLADPSRIKPGVHMPAFGMLDADELDAIAAYLDALE